MGKENLCSHGMQALKLESFIRPDGLCLKHISGSDVLVEIGA